MKQYFQRLILYLSSFKGFQILLALFCLVFLSFYFSLAYHVRPAVDDFQKMVELHDRGVWGFMSEYYHQWSFKWSTMLLESLVFSSVNFSSSYLVWIYFYYFISLLILVLAISNILHFLMKKIFKDFLPTKFFLFNLSVFVISMIYFINPIPVESWFWLSGSLGYFQVLIFFFVQGACILSSKSTKTTYAILILSSLILGGNVEISAMNLLIVYFFLLLYLKYFHLVFIQNAYGRNLFRKLSYSAILVFLSSLPAYFAPGTMKRLGFERLKNSGHFSGRFNFMDKNLFEYLMQSRSLIFVFCLLILFMSVLQFKKEFKQKVNREMLKEFLVISGLISLALFLFNFVFFQFIYSNLGILRAWSFFSLVLLIHLVGLIFYLAMQVKISFHPLSSVNLMLLTFMGILGYTIYNQNTKLNTYTDAYDSRVQYLLKKKSEGQEGVVVLPRLPDSGMIIQGDITTEKDRYLNKYYARALGLNAELGVKIR